MDIECGRPPGGEPSSSEKISLSLAEPTRAELGERFTGRCKWFNVSRGFGFVLKDPTVEDEGEEELFVHQSELHMDGFRSLQEEERVAFSIRPGKNGKVAWYVTAEDPGAALKGSLIRPLGKNKTKMIRCFKCGLYGNHVASKCKKVTIDGKVCYHCKEADHLINECPTRPQQAVNRHRQSSTQSKEEVPSK